jgi:hypothetical protein
MLLASVVAFAPAAAAADDPYPASPPNPAPAEPAAPPQGDAPAPQDRATPVDAKNPAAPHGAANGASNGAPNSAANAAPAAPVATRGGRLIDFGGVRAEAVHDPALGTLTVYGLPASAPAAAPGAPGSQFGSPMPGAPMPGSQVSGSSCGRMSARGAPASAPVLVLNDANGPRTLTAVQVSDERGAWRFSDPALRAASFDARIRIAGRDGPLEASWAAAESGAPHPASADVPGREGWRQGGWASGGPTTLSTRSARLETTHDAEAGAITIVTRDHADGFVELRSAPTLVMRLPSGERTVTFERVEGRPNTWRAQAEELKAGVPLGTVKVDVDGRTEEVELISSGEDRPTPASLPASQPPREEGAMPEHGAMPEPAPAPAPNGRADLERRGADPAAASGGVVVLGDGAVRLKVEPSANGDSITLVPLSAQDARALGRSTPEVLVAGADGDRTITATALGEGRGWTLRDPALLAHRSDLRVRVRLDGKTLEAPLVLAGGEGKVGLHGGPIAVFAEGDASVEVVRDLEAGSMILHLRDGTSERKSLDAIEVVVRTADGEKTLRAEPMSDVPGAFRVSDEALKARDLSGSLRIRRGGRTLEAQIPAARTDLPRPIDAPRPGSDEIGGTPNPDGSRPATEPRPADDRYAPAK